MFNVITKGTQIPWAGLVKPTEKGLPMDPKYAYAVADMYKNVNYWASSLTVDQIGNYFDTFKPNDGLIDKWYAHTKVSPKLPNGEDNKAYLPAGDFRKLVARKVTRRLILRELQSYSSKYNPAAKVEDRLMGKAFGEIIHQDDVNNIIQLLGNEVGKNLQVEAVLGKDSEQFIPLFTDEKDVLEFLQKAELFDASQTVIRLGKIVGDVGEKMWHFKRFK